MNCVVILDVESTHTYYIDDVASPEEAEEIAEGLFEKGENGDEVENDILSVDSFPDTEREDS